MCQVNQMKKDDRVTRRSFVAGTIVLGLAASGAAVGIAAKARDADPSGAATPGASPEASPKAMAEIIIAMTMSLTFDPAEITIPAGTTVTWNNASQMPHTATGDPDQNPVGQANPDYVLLPEGAEPWGSELLQPGETYSHRFDAPGEYRYICIPHVLSGMRGTIIVQEPED